MRAYALAILLFAAACAPAPPTTPPEYEDPPAVATEGLRTITVVEEIPMSVPRLRAFQEKNLLTDFFEPTDTIAAPDELEILRGTWPTPGAVRRVKLTDGHYVIERILENRPELFTYQIWVFTNAAGRGVEQIIGEQRFIATGPNSTRFEWDYKIKPKSAVTGFFVDRQLPEIEAFLQSGMSGFAAAATEAAGG